MERVEKFLKEAGTYYLATVDGNQPRVRPFGTAHIFEGKLYIKQVNLRMYLSRFIQILRLKFVHSKMANGLG